eukprot:15243383-Alexandrium_andersonii.AAC.1
MAMSRHVSKEYPRPSLVFAIGRVFPSSENRARLSQGVQNRHHCQLFKALCACRKSKKTLFRPGR